MKTIYRSKNWLAAVGQIEQCVLCGRWGTQVAHRNELKGMGLKPMTAPPPRFARNVITKLTTAATWKKKNAGG